MLLLPIPANANASLEEAAEHLNADLRDLDELKAICLKMARLAQEHTQAQLEAAQADPDRTRDPAAILPSGAAALDRAARALRRSVLLKQHLLANRPIPSAQRRTSARKRILRTVEDEIYDAARGERAERLNAELLDRIDSPDLDDDIEHRPVEDIVNEIRRDLGLSCRPGTRGRYKPRTTDDLAVLNARAALPPGASASTIPDAPPRSDPAPDDDDDDDDPALEQPECPDSVLGLLAALEKD